MTSQWNAGKMFRKYAMAYGNNDDLPASSLRIYILYNTFYYNNNIL